MSSSGFSTDFLAFIAHGLRDTKKVKEGDIPITDQAKVLDSVACISISHAEKQTVAVGVQVVNDGILVHVAANDPLPPATLPHLRDIFARLQRIYKLHSQERSPGIPSFISSRTENPFKIELLQLEIAILRFSWRKLAQRLTKDSRAEIFITVLEDVCGAPATQRTDLSGEERELLGKLQASPDLNKDLIDGLASQVDELAKTLHLEANDEGAILVRQCIYSLMKLRQDFSNKWTLVVSWNLYTKLRANNRLSDGETSRKAPDVLRWISKVVSIREHYMRLATVCTSNRLSNLLLRNIGIKEMVNSMPPASHSLDIASLKEVLVAAGSAPEDPEPMGEFLEILAASHSVSLGPTGKLETETLQPAHCECALLVYLHGQPSIAYIGVSRLSCQFCHDYFTAYREATASTTCTRGTHGQSADWQCPTLVDSELDSKIRGDLSSKFLPRIRKGWEARWPSSLASQIPYMTTEERRFAEHGDGDEDYQKEMVRLGRRRV
ncbi:hypothetical protein B0H16DRAFT_1876951 [Mycena metata]|uniref:Uncharacterized protein n=1 Tax=Mycena metata TaxID=1033252 RepID=A0AAD7P1V8_9AGAR|nr:hypothetical protein B0H16DRAFT_1876951 [Mycena metata]